MTDAMLDVIIIGAGLTGMSLAKQLTEQGRNILVLEARDRIGGRIHTLSTRDGTPVEMGATWFFPFFTNMLKTLQELRVELMEQYMKGYTVYESDPRSPPRKVNQGDSDDMFRIKGGTSHMVNTLYQRLDPGRVLLNQVVTNINNKDSTVEVVTGDNTYRAKRVVTTIPPQLLAHSVTFDPPLPREVELVARETHTWMGESMKGAVTYAKPFWKENGYAGALYSQAGPCAQFYDQTSTDGTKFALVGFMDEKTAKLPVEKRRAKVVEQLVRVFGEEARQPLDYTDTYWADQEFTMPKNARRLFSHKNNGHSVYQQSYYAGKLYIGGTETSGHAGGYMEGAVSSANKIAKWIKDDLA